MYRRTLSALVVAFAAAIASTAAPAQDFPSRAITIIVPQPPGGGTDIISRIIGDQFSIQLARLFSSRTAPAPAWWSAPPPAAEAAADGGLLAGLNANMAVNPTFRQAGLDPIRDFTPVGMMAEFPFVLVVSDDFPAPRSRNSSRWRRPSPAKSISRQPAMAAGNICRWRCSS